jgi:uncharacterized protein DUF6702
VVIAPGGWLALALRALAAAHPMHTSVTELTQDARARSVAVSVRVFADDFGSVADRTGPAAEQYVQAHLELTGPTGSPVVLRWEGATLVGDVVQIRLRGDLPAGLSGARVGVTLLCDRFPDQVNIVRARYQGRTASLLFARGDHPKALP